MSKITFYIGIHNGDNGEAPVSQAENVYEIDTTYSHAIKVLRVMDIVMKDWIRLGQLVEYKEGK